MKIAILTASLLSLFAAAAAAGESACITSGLAQKFVVSGLLRKSGDGMIVKIAHSIEITSNANEAADRFASKVQQMYPGYSVLSTLTSPEACETPMAPVMGVQQLRL